LKNDIHLVYKEYTDDLKDFDEQNKSMVACEVMLRSEPNYLRMIVNIETKEIMDDNVKPLLFSNISNGIMM
jgi:hypothetical protein